MARGYLHANPAMTLLPALSFGFVLGMRHATDADHIAAIGTIVAGARSARRAALVGATWGLGHSMSVLLVGGALVAFQLTMPIRVALALEFGVAIMLIALGVRSLVVRRRESTEVSAKRPLFIGIVHGMAGSAVLALLVLGTTTSALTAALYLVCFCIGTIAGMAAITTLLALPTQLGSARLISFERGIRVIAGCASLALGLAMAHKVGVRDGLFAATPTWSSE